jgi:hypothetical protein
MQHAATNISVSARMMSSLLSCREKGQASANIRCSTSSKDDVTSTMFTAADTKIALGVTLLWYLRISYFVLDAN